MEKQKKAPRIISGVVILMFSNMLVKLMGLFFKIPLHSYLGDLGMGYFNVAYNIFVTLYMISTAGLPIAISIMVSGSRTLGKKREVRKIFRVALLLFIVLGIIGTLIMILGAKPLASLMGSPSSYYCIITIAPTLFFICVSSAVRGYFQGHQNMAPTAISEVIEAIGKFAVGIIMCRFAISCGYSIEISAAYAIAGIGIGVGTGMIFLIAAKIFHKQDYSYLGIEDSDECLPGKTILKRLVVTAVPITLSAVALNLTGIIDSITIINRMSGYVTTQEAEAAYGNYSTLAVTLSHLPSALIVPISSALTPALASAKAENNTDRLNKTMNAALKFAAVISIPCAIGMSVLSHPILSMLFRKSAKSVNSAAPLLSVLSISVFFTAILTITNSILQSNKLEKKPIISMFCGAAVKLIMNLILIGIPGIGIYGAPIGTVISYFVMATLNFYFVAKYVHLDVKILKSFFKPFAATLISSVFTIGSFKLLSKVMPTSVATLTAIFITVIVYVVLLFVTKIISKEELMMIPKGAKICRLLVKLGFKSFT